MTRVLGLPRLGEYLSLDKISKADGLNVTSVLESSGVRDRFLVGCEDCASHIIPDLALIKNKVQRAGGASTKRPKTPHQPRGELTASLELVSRNLRTSLFTGQCAGGARASMEVEAQARQLWADNAEHEVFSFDDSGIDGIVCR